jgi:hypothetical protein
MKKYIFGAVVGFIVITVSVFGQAVDKSQYKAIDPFDYKLNAEKAAKGRVEKFKSVVQFDSQSGTTFSFSSLDQGTTLTGLKSDKYINPPAAAQRVTIYYTATKGAIDSLTLDEIDYTNSTEAGIGLKKSTVPASSGIRKSDYKEIELLHYKIDAENAQRDDVRKYKSTVKFSSQDGIKLSFTNLDGGTLISPKVSRRFPSFTPNQRVTIYYTATKGIVDSLTLDDVEF